MTMPDSICGTSEELLFKPIFTSSAGQTYYLLELPSKFIYFPKGSFLNIDSDERHPKFEKYTRGVGGINVKCDKFLGKKNGNPVFLVDYSNGF